MENVTPIDRQSESFISLKGQYVGFFNTLSQWLLIAAKTCSHSLDQISERDIISRANDGLFFDENAYIKHLSQLVIEQKKPVG